MKFVVFSFILALLFQSCADSRFLDKTRKDQSVLEGTNINPDHTFAKSVVLIAQDLAVQDGKPIFFGICTGLIIGPRAVLTAAHCLDNGTNKMKVILNPTPRESLSFHLDVYSVVGSRLHPTYENHKLSNQKTSSPKTIEGTLGYVDLAVMVVEQEFPAESLFNNPLLEIYNRTAGFATVAGYGKTTALRDTKHLDYRTINGVLKQAQISLPTNYFESSLLTLRQWNTTGVCKGDSGSPLFVGEKGNYKLLAIAIGVFKPDHELVKVIPFPSEYDECAGYGVYLNVETFKPWILKASQELEAKTALLQNPILFKN